LGRIDKRDAVLARGGSDAARSPGEILEITTKMGRRLLHRRASFVTQRGVVTASELSATDWLPLGIRRRSLCASALDLLEAMPLVSAAEAM
jgi:hypothetical protein